MFRAILNYIKVLFKRKLYIKRRLLSEILADDYPEAVKFLEEIYCYEAASKFKFYHEEPDIVSLESHTKWYYALIVLTPTEGSWHVASRGSSYTNYGLVVDGKVTKKIVLDMIISMKRSRRLYEEGIV